MRRSSSRQAEAGEDLPPLGQVPVAERGASRRAASPTSRRAAPCSRLRRRPRSTRVGKGLEAGVGVEVASPSTPRRRRAGRARRSRRRRRGAPRPARSSKASLVEVRVAVAGPPAAVPGAAASHSASVGSRAPRPRAKAAASYQLTWHDRAVGVEVAHAEGGALAPGPVRPANPVPRVGDVLLLLPRPRLVASTTRGARSRRPRRTPASVAFVTSVRPMRNGGELDLVARALVVVGEGGGGPAPSVLRAAGDVDELEARCGRRGRRGGGAVRPGGSKSSSRASTIVWSIVSTCWSSCRRTSSCRNRVERPRARPRSRAPARAPSARYRGRRGRRAARSRRARPAASRTRRTSRRGRRAAGRGRRGGARARGPHRRRCGPGPRRAGS